MYFKKFNRLTADEFMLLQGTEKMSQMISNKWYCDDDVLDLLDQASIGQWCAIKHHEGYIVYFESMEDVRLVNQYLQPKEPDMPKVHSINIVDEFRE